MRRAYYRFKRQMQVPKELYRVNLAITAPELRVIDEENKQLGVLSLPQALEIARSRELDLVEVSPKETPPVARILNYGQFKYWKEKEAHKQKVGSHRTDIKGVRLSLRIGAHDKELRKNQALNFFDDGHKVRVEMVLRGRERAHLDLAKTIMREFVATLGDDITVEQDIQAQGGKVSMIVFRK
jgi:translation initiation factor IF-3